MCAKDPLKSHLNLFTGPRKSFGAGLSKSGGQLVAGSVLPMTMELGRLLRVRIEIRDIFESHVQMVVQDEKFLASIIHNILAKVINQEGDIGGLSILVLSRKCQRMATLVGKEHLQASSAFDSVSHVVTP